MSFTREHKCLVQSPTTLMWTEKKSSPGAWGLNIIEAHVKLIIKDDNNGAIIIIRELSHL